MRAPVRFGAAFCRGGVGEVLLSDTFMRWGAFCARWVYSLAVTLSYREENNGIVRRAAELEDWRVIRLKDLR